jgi:hypothetical protein
MKIIFIATLGLGMILNVAAASAQGYPFGSGNTDMPWSVNQQSAAELLGMEGNTLSVDQRATADPHRNRVAQSQTSTVAQEQRRQAGN